MEDVTRLSRCARCGTGLPIDTKADVCATCAAALASDLTVLARPAGAGDETRIVSGLGATPGANDVTVLSARSAARGPVAPKLIAGGIFGPYRVERLLGRGGMGDVYEAEHLDHGRRVAIKVLNSSLAGEEDRARFLSEGQLAASITHTNTVYIYGSEEIGGAPVIAMELLSGGTLRDLVQAKGPLPPAQAVDAILQVIAGLDAAARAGILHRDVKPANCFVDLDGNIKVGDFGLSITTVAHQQQTGMFLGTPQFAPPEQIRGQALDLRADIYAVGGTLFYLLTGRPPFDDNDLTTLITRVTTEAPRSPREMSANVPAALGEIVKRCLSKDRADRPATYAALEDLLRPFASAAPVPASLGRRAAAGAIDQILFAMFMAPVGMYLVFTGSSERRWLVAVINVPLIFAYFTLLEGRWAASVGKLATGLRVARRDGQQPDFARAAGRSIIYQTPAIVMIAIIWLIGVTEFDDFMRMHPLLGMTFMFSFYAGVAVLFSTARRRNGFAAFQDLATDTRVVRQRHRLERITLDLPARATLAASSAPTYSGPFELGGPLGSTGTGVLQAGFDPLLKRSVWIHVLPIGTPALAPGLRDLNRTTRLRWLGGRRTATEAWDAYEAFDGVPLAALRDPQPWGIVRRWLLDLAREVEAGLKDRSLVALTPERVWITRDGHAALLDFPAPGLEERIASESPSNATAQRWLAAVAARGLNRTDASGPLPMSAQAFLDRLTKQQFTAPDAISAEAVAVQSRPDRVARWRRAAAVMAQALLPAFGVLIGFFVSMAASSPRFSIPDAIPAAVALEHLAALKTDTPESADERRRVAIYIAATYRSTLENESAWTSPMSAMRLAPHRALARRVLAEHPAVSSEELAEATATLGPFLKAQAQEQQDARDRAAFIPKVASVTMLGIMLAIAGVFGVLFAFAFGGGLLMRAFGLAVVNRRGQPAARLRAALRALVAWAPAFAFVYLEFKGKVPLRDLAYARLHPGATAAILGTAILFTAGALIAAFGTTRSIQDRVAGTYVVPR